MTGKSGLGDDDFDEREEDDFIWGEEDEEYGDLGNVGDMEVMGLGQGEDGAGHLPHSSEKQALPSGPSFMSDFELTSIPKPNLLSLMDLCRSTSEFQSLILLDAG